MISDAQIIFEKVGLGQTLYPDELERFKTLGNRLSTLDSAVSPYMGAGDIWSANTLHFPFPFYPIGIYNIASDTVYIDVDFSSVGPFNHLLVLGQARVNGTGGQKALSLLLRFNGDTGSNYSWHVNGAYGYTAVLSEALSDTAGILCAVPADGATAGYSGGTVTYVTNVGGPLYKQAFSLNGYEDGTHIYNSNFRTTWRSTNPVSSLRIAADTATYVNAKITAGSVFSVYGIK